MRAKLAAHSCNKIEVMTTYLPYCHTRWVLLKVCSRLAEQLTPSLPALSWLRWLSSRSQAHLAENTTGRRSSCRPSPDHWRQHRKPDAVMYLKESRSPEVDPAGQGQLCVAFNCFNHSNEFFASSSLSFQATIFLIEIDR